MVPLSRFPQPDSLIHSGENDGIEIIHNGAVACFEEGTAARILVRLCSGPPPTVESLVREVTGGTSGEELMRALSELIRLGLISLETQPAPLA